MGSKYIVRNILNLDWLTAKRALLLVLITFGLLMITNAEPYVRSDGYYYFHTAQCLLNEGDFVCSKKPEYWPYMDNHTKNIFRGKYVSVTAPGTSILNLPLLAVAKLAGNNLDLSNSYFKAYNGHTLFEGLAIVINSIIFALFSLILIYKTLRNLRFSEKNSIISTGLVFLSSYAIWYVFLFPIYTHIYEIFSVALLTFATTKYFTSKRPKYALLMGIAIGIMIIIRPVLAPVALFSLTIFLTSKDIKGFIRFCLGGLPFAIIYVLYNWISYGTLITSGYDSVRGETFTFNSFNGLNVLFSIYRGWFIYSPLMILGIIGLIILYKRNKHISFIGLASISSLVVIYGFWPNWWGGGSFGSRFMLFSTPLMAIGLATFIAHIRDLQVKKLTSLFSRLGIPIVTLCTIFTVSITLLFRVTPIGADFYTPLHFYKTQIMYIREAVTIVGYINKNLGNIQGGSGILAILTGTSNAVLKVTNTDSAITMEMFKPPYLRRELPNVVEFILVNKETKTIYSGIYSNPKISDKVIITCTPMCASEDNRIRLSNIEGTLSELRVGEFVGISLENNYSIFFKDALNIQFRGSFIPWVPEEGVYKLF